MAQSGNGNRGVLCDVCNEYHSAAKARSHGRAAADYERRFGVSI